MKRDDLPPKLLVAALIAVALWLWLPGLSLAFCLLCAVIMLAWGAVENVKYVAHKAR